MGVPRTNGVPRTLAIAPSKNGVPRTPLFTQAAGIQLAQMGFRVRLDGVPCTSKRGSAYKAMGFRVFPQGVPRTP